MTDNSEKINECLKRLEILLKRHNDFSREISNLQIEISKLKLADTERTLEQRVIRPHKPVTQPAVQVKNEEVRIVGDVQNRTDNPVRETLPPIAQLPKVKSNLEKFIGENLTSKIGIAITVFGVAIGAKYAIDHQLISPLTRIILGYLVGASLLAFAIKLKKGYENLSAVLLSGAMATMYFITYSAYSLYGLIPQPLAFILMVIFTAFTVAAAITYEKQIIAHIGLVGAYAVPFLLGDNSGRVEILFSYMAILNIGILAIALKKYWKPLYYVSFGLSWLIFFIWYIDNYQTGNHFGLGLTFLSIFFIIFYLTFLAYKLVKNEKFQLPDILLLLLNSFFFYGIGYSMIANKDATHGFLGLFTLLNAIVHFLVSLIIFRRRLVDKSLFYLISGLVLIFITIAIPVQLDGNWVTLIWAGEAALLYWIGKTKGSHVYEQLAYPLMLVAFFSLVHDWSNFYNAYDPKKPGIRLIPLLNVNFLSSMLFAGAFSFMSLLNRNRNDVSDAKFLKGIAKSVDVIIPAILLVTLYYAFRLEIANYWDQLYADSGITINSGNNQLPYYYQNYDLRSFRIVWIINYSLLFVAAMAFVNIKKLHSRSLALVSIVVIVLALIVFLTQGLYALSELRESYLNQASPQYYHKSVFNICARYISFAFAALALIAFYRCSRQNLFRFNLKIAFDFLLHISILWIASSELINLMQLAGATQSYKLGLSILWGVYSLYLISLGIWKNKKHLRMGAIILFAVTLLKLFFYDISHLDTIAKTVVLISLGVLLLIISFLYTKYKHVISNETEN